MAEGHAVHALARRFGAAFTGTEPRVTSPQGSFATEAASLDQHAVADTQAYGKNLLVSFADAPTVHVHLGMFGRFSVRLHRRAIRDGWLRTDPPTTGTERLRLLTTTHLGDLSRPLTCRLLDPAGVDALLARLGPDPLREDHDPHAAVRALHASERPIGMLLLDQSTVAGIGNVYRAELLHRARLSPWQPGRSIPPERLAALWDDAIRLMSIGERAGWIVTDENQVAAAVSYLEREERVPRWTKEYGVYQRAGLSCRVCAAPIQAAAQGRQRVFWCPGCQPQT